LSRLRAVASITQLSQHPRAGEGPAIHAFPWEKPKTRMPGTQPSLTS